MGAIHFSLDENLLVRLKQELALEVFVETGNFQGDSLAVARKHFDTCYSVELSDELHRKAIERFRGQTGITIHHGPSPEFLKQKSAEFEKRPVLFWLDAHWCVAEGTSGADSQSPLLDELRGIGRLHRDSVILIDDARLYLCAPPKPHRMGDWPDLDDICRLLFQISSEHRLMVYNDVIVFYPTRIQAAMRQLAHEQGIDWLVLIHKSRALPEGLAGWVLKKQRKFERFKQKLKADK